MRRTGKTYRMFQKMRELLDSGVARQRMRYLNFEDERLGNVGIDDFLHDVWGAAAASCILTVFPRLRSFVLVPAGFPDGPWIGSLPTWSQVPSIVLVLVLGPRKLDR